MLFSKKSQQNKIIVHNTNIVFPANKNQTILEAAEAAGINMPYGCRSGSCTSCKCKLISGKTHQDFSSADVLSRSEIKEGTILACQHTTLSDIEIEANLVEGVSLEKQKEVTASITNYVQRTHDIIEITLKTSDKLAYIPGQYADLYVKGIEDPRSYSFASAPRSAKTNVLNFQIRLVPGGEMSGWLHKQNRTGETVRIKGPYGSFFLRNTERPILCIAGGSGMAPVKAILEGALGIKRPVTYLFGARSQADLYCLEEMNHFQKKWKAAFNFIPALSDEDSESDWQGQRGMVTDVLENTNLDLKEYEAYLCGPPVMIDKSIPILQKMGIDNQNIFFDKFLDKSH